MSIQVQGTTVIDDSRKLVNITEITLGGSAGTSGQVITSQGTGVAPTWSSGSAVTTYSYNNRATLRGLSPSAGAQAIISGIGLFVFQESVFSLDDDETCFVTGTGSWLLESPHWQFIDAHTNGDPSILLAKEINTIISVGASQAAYQNIICPGAYMDMAVVVSPPGVLSPTVGVWAFVPEPNVIRLAAFNASAGSSASLPSGYWTAAAITF